MAKLAFFAVILVALVALSAAEGDNNLNLQIQCQRELQESSLNACRQVVDQQLAIELPFLLPRSSQLGTGVRVQCCQQLRDISGVCRVAAIRQIVRQYEHQTDPYYPGEDEEQQGGSYYPGETYPQQEQGWAHQQGQGWYRPSQTHQQQQGQGWYSPSQTHQQQQGQGWYRPSQTHQQQQGQGWYRPSETSQEQQQEQEWYRPSQTHQQQGQGWYRPSQTSRPQQHQQGSYRPSQTSPHQQQQEGGFCSQSTAQQQQQQKGTQEPYGLNDIFRHFRQPAQRVLGQSTQQDETGFSGCSSPPRFGTDQQTARLTQLKVVARARQVAAQLPAMCRLEGSAFSAGHY